MRRPLFVVVARFAAVCAVAGALDVACAPPPLAVALDAGPALRVDAGVVAEDGGASDVDAGNVALDCAATPTAKQCDGDVLHACAQGREVGVDCPVQFPGAVCGEVSVAFGASCLLAPGTGCLDDETGGVLPCAGPDAACVDTGFDASCTQDVGVCDDADTGTCRGDDLVYACAATQPYTVACGEIGGRCVAGTPTSTHGHCADAPAGAFCFPDYVECAAGIACEDYLCTAPPDAGVVDDADGG